METRVAGPSLTARELEVARMIGLGLTNKEIAQQLDIRVRTVGAHVQNILNKLGAANRAQIATWAALHVELRPVATVHVVQTPAVQATPLTTARPPLIHLSSNVQVALLVMAGLLFTLVFPADHTVAPPTAAAAVSSQRGDLVFDARFDPDGHEFSLRYVLNEPDASAVRFVDGGIEYSVLKPGGNTGNSLSLGPMPAFFVEYEMSVKPGSNVVFWLNFSLDDPSRGPGNHLLQVDTPIEAMQLGYFTGGDNPILPLGPQVTIHGLQSGRHFTISALVQAPVYRVFLDGVRVMDVTHAAPRGHQAVGFGIFGSGTGTVRLSTIRVYTVR